MHFNIFSEGICGKIGIFHNGKSVIELSWKNLPLEVNDQPGLTYLQCTHMRLNWRMYGCSRSGCSSVYFELILRTYWVFGIGYTLIVDKWGGCWLLIGKVEWSVNIASERVCPGPRHPAQQQQGRGTARRPSSDGDQLILQITFLVFLHNTRSETAYETVILYLHQISLTSLFILEDYDIQKLPQQ